MNSKNANTLMEIYVAITILRIISINKVCIKKSIYFLIGQIQYVILINNVMFTPARETIHKTIHERFYLIHHTLGMVKNKWIW